MPPRESSEKSTAWLQIPKAELHVHFEGCIQPNLLVKLAEAHGEKIEYERAAERYNTQSFPAFLELFKWVTFYLRGPGDYAQAAEVLALRLEEENYAYAEITLSVGVMLLRKQDVEANFRAIAETVAARKSLHTRIRWIFDAVRQFGAAKALEVAGIASRLKSEGVVAFGLGGDEESLPAADFRGVYEFAAGEGLHRVAHAGEMGGPESVREAVEILGAERIGHGIAAIRDGGLIEMLAERQIPLEICPKSNLCTGALEKLLGIEQARIEDHPLAKFVERGVPVTLATDDPAMFRTSLTETYEAAELKMGLSRGQLVRIAEAGFRHAFIPSEEKAPLLKDFRSEALRLGLL